jgi:hypothetical protein
MPLQATSGAASYDAFGGGVPVVPVFIEDTFSCFLYTGNASTQTITNGIDLSTKGGLVWSKIRSGGGSHQLIDTARGRAYSLQSNLTDAQTGPSSAPNDLTSFNTDGFSLGVNQNIGINTSGSTYVSWTFRKQPKFFDVVTYTGTGSNTTIAHNLGSVPGCIIIKGTDSTFSWKVYHRSTGNTTVLNLNLTDAAYSGLTTYWNSTTPTSTVFSLGNDASVNANGSTYIAYIFAHDAGGFGLTGTDNVISCGSFTTDGSGTATVSLGYEPQWLMVKSTAIAQNWFILDTMRGMSYSESLNLKPNTSGAEVDFGPNVFVPTATGFVETAGLTPSETYIYIAIRRGPMKVPTLGTSVFAPATRTGTGATATVTTTISPVDMLWVANTSGALGTGPSDFDRLRGANQRLSISSTAAEVSTTDTVTGFDVQNGYRLGADASGYGVNYSSQPFVNWNFKRAPSFFDEVCYSGTDVAKTITHNLTVVPELMIVKSRIGVASWIVYDALNGATNATLLNTTNASFSASGLWNNTAPTSSVFTVGANGSVNGSGQTYVAYLFATCAGVSKVGSYTGTGTTQTINCGFTAGSRFIMIKRTDSTGDWYVWDSARGIISGNDPYLLLNSSAAEVTNTDYVDTYSAGFEISSTAPAAINASAGTFIFLAIA